jgi:hypothetical protein
MDESDGINSLPFSFALPLSACDAFTAFGEAGSCVGNIEAAGLARGSGSVDLPPSATIAIVLSLMSTNSRFNRSSFDNSNSADCSLCLNLARTFLILAVDASPPTKNISKTSSIFLMSSVYVQSVQYLDSVIFYFSIFIAKFIQNLIKI